jgi:hypothetical protein
MENISNERADCPGAVCTNYDNYSKTMFTPLNVISIIYLSKLLKG